MKKLFFTAIAFIAFSSISTANTLAIEEKPELNTETNKELGPCGTLTSVYINGEFIGSTWSWSLSLNCSGLAFRDLKLTIGGALNY